MRMPLSIAVLVTGCKGLLGIDDDVTLVDGSADGRVVQDDALVDGSVDGSDPDACPANYDLMPNGGRYRVPPLRSEWMAAAADCADDTFGARTHLVVISSDTERVALAPLGSGERVWIGLSKRTGQMQWVTVEPAPVPDPSDPVWQTGEPDGLAQPCVNLENGELADDACSNNNEYICECDGFPDDPTRY